VKGVKETRVSIIGAGALGGAVATGLAKAGCKVLASDAHPERLGRLREYGVELVADNARAAKEGEVVMFALKPHLILDVVGKHGPLLKDKLCVSLAAAVTLEMLIRATDSQNTRWARAMTNICAALNCAFTGVARSDSITEADMSWMKEAFGLLGTVEESEEKNLDALTALTGAAPAFFMSLMEAAALGGIQAGIPKDTAYKAAAGVLMGVSRLYMEQEKHPAASRDDVCTPGGMTIEGIYELERSGARAAMMKAIVLTAEKGKVLTDKIAADLEHL
jgi:pyrroline-5-carboxylate reductase